MISYISKGIHKSLSRIPNTSYKFTLNLKSRSFKYQQTRVIHGSSIALNGLFHNTVFESPHEMPPRVPKIIGNEWDIHSLRRKNWDDLHELWWVLCRERNRLLTSSVEYRKYRLHDAMETTSSRYKKVKLSMKNIKLVINERYTAWVEAQKMWNLHLNGINISDPAVYEKFKTIERDQAQIEKIIRIGRFLPRRGAEILPKVKILKSEAVKAFKKINYTSKTRLRLASNQESSDIIDLRPLHDRRHWSRRRVGKFRRKKYLV